MEINNNNPALFQMAKPDPALNFWLNQWTPELFIVRVAMHIPRYYLPEYDCVRASNPFERSNIFH